MPEPVTAPSASPVEELRNLAVIVKRCGSLTDAGRWWLIARLQADMTEPTPNGDGSSTVE